MLAEFWQNVGRILILSWAFQSLKSRSCLGALEKRSYGATVADLAEIWQNCVKILAELC